jgi:hypothetical protein
VAPGRLEHLPDGAVVGDRVRHRAHRDEAEAAVRSGLEAAAEMILGRLRTLHRVEPVVAVLPHVELGAGDRLAGGAEHAAEHPHGVAGVRLHGDRVAVAAAGRAGNVERPEHGRLGRLELV